jgi:D-amino peptidase
MTGETLAAIEGAKAAGATEIWVKDAHASGQNLLIDQLPADVKVVRSWAGHPFGMVQELNGTFDALVMIGYHSSAGSEANSLAHSLSLDAAKIRLNGRRASEFLIYALAAASVGVPAAFVSGDAGLMVEIAQVNSSIRSCAVKEGAGQLTVLMSPSGARLAISQGVQNGLSGDLTPFLLEIEPRYVLEIAYSDPNLAARHQHYPGAWHVGNRTIRFETDHYFDVLRMLTYVTYGHL